MILLSILLLRLNILNKYVDYFVICEAREDHRGNSKKLNFNSSKFSKFKEKIIYLIVDRFENCKRTWDRQNFQRDYLINGITNADKDDIILFSDIDEIPNLDGLNFNIINNKPLPIYGKGRNSREWIHVTDHCEALLKIFFKGKIGESYNVGSNQNINNVNLTKKLLKIAKTKSLKISKKVKIIFVKDRPGHDFRYALDSSKIQKKLKWKSKISLNVGLLKTFDWYKLKRVTRELYRGLAPEVPAKYPVEKFLPRHSSRIPSVKGANVAPSYFIGLVGLLLPAPAHLEQKHEAPT